MATHPAMTLTCLGTSDAFGTAGRHCAGYLVETEASRLLVDAGPSVLSALKAVGRATDEIDAVLLSHLHGDHFGGVPFLLLEYMYEAPRRRPLVVVGPLGTEARVFELFRALYADAGRDPVPFPLHFVELDGSDVHEVGDVRLETFAVPHMRTGLALGLRLRSPSRTLTYSGDTAWTPLLIDASRGADLFLCECSTFETPVPGHIRYPEIEANRRRMECGDLVLTHLGHEMRARGAELPETLANDGLLLVVGEPAASRQTPARAVPARRGAVPATPAPRRRRTR
jgi:ribonuclease BN (tRNA processing enzyme)